MLYIGPELKLILQKEYKCQSCLVLKVAVVQGDQQIWEGSSKKRIKGCEKWEAKKRRLYNLEKRKLNKDDKSLKSWKANSELYLPVFTYNHTHTHN